MILGTAAYMSPEQAKGQDRRQARRHLGVRVRAVRDAVTGSRAFDGEDGFRNPRRRSLKSEPPTGALSASVPATSCSRSFGGVSRRTLANDVRDIGRRALGDGGARSRSSRRRHPPAAPSVVPARASASRGAGGAVGIVSLAALVWGAFAYFRPALQAAEAIRFFSVPPDAWNFQSQRRCHWRIAGSAWRFRRTGVGWPSWPSARAITHSLRPLARTRSPRRRSPALTAPRRLSGRRIAAFSDSSPAASSKRIDVAAWPVH